MHGNDDEEWCSSSGLSAAPLRSPDMLRARQGRWKEQVGHVKITQRLPGNTRSRAQNPVFGRFE
eukprot:1104637-Prymnesium_polylepis.1